jgi:hypothetical protein
MLEEKQVLRSPNDDRPSELGREKEGKVQFLLGAEPRAGDLCPVCKEAQLDYDGLLNLSCPKCGYTLAGCFT